MCDYYYGIVALISPLSPRIVENQSERQFRGGFSIACHMISQAGKPQTSPSGKVALLCGRVPCSPCSVSVTVFKENECMGPVEVNGVDMRPGLWNCRATTVGVRWSDCAFGQGKIFHLGCFCQFHPMPQKGRLTKVCFHDP